MMHGNYRGAGDSDFARAGLRNRLWAVSVGGSTNEWAEVQLPRGVYRIGLAPNNGNPSFDFAASVLVTEQGSGNQTATVFSLQNAPGTVSSFTGFHVIPGESRRFAIVDENQVIQLRGLVANVYPLVMIERIADDY